jgi:hypothetical protein
MQEDHSKLIEGDGEYTVSKENRELEEKYIELQKEIEEKV